MSDKDHTHSEHDFLAFCAKIENEAKNWETLKVGFSQKLNQREILHDILKAPTLLKAAREEALGVFQNMNNQAQALKTEAVSYIFSDNDILLFSKTSTPEIRERFDVLRQNTAKTLPADVTLEHFNAGEKVEDLKKFADEKMRTARQTRALTNIVTGTAQRDTVSIQRKNRTLPLVMLIEDDRFTAAYTALLLTKNYEVFHVRTGEEAVEYYMNYAPNAVFIDVHLPGISGTDTLQMIKAMDPDAYCVMLSVDTSRATVMTASEEGASGYLRKPYDKDRLLRTVQQSPHIPDIPESPIKEIVHT